MFVSGEECYRECYNHFVVIHKYRKLLLYEPKEEKMLKVNIFKREILILIRSFEKEGWMFDFNQLQNMPEKELWDLYQDLKESSSINADCTNGEEI